jgi:hypothetical protein
VTAAKIYIVDHYKEVNDYSDLHLILRSGASGLKFYFGPKMGNRISKSRIISEMLRDLGNQTITIKTFGDAIYDWSDGDFSVVFNGVPYNWIDSDSIINIASYIEEKLKKNEI